MADASGYSAFKALDPFFAIIKMGLDGLVDGDHFWISLPRARSSSFSTTSPVGREARGTSRHHGGLLRIRAQYFPQQCGRARRPSRLDPRIVILEYEGHGIVLSNGRAYNNRFASIITVENRKVVHWRDYMDSLAMRAIVPPNATLGSLA
ncbi:MAG: hypothetical protein WDO24_12190 [Pseudomonadota bacterium]